MLALAISACNGPSEPVNVVLIVVDTLRASAIGSESASTPHIDALAADGVLFERAFSHAPMTLPAHTSLFSSRLPMESGVVNNGQQVPGDLPLLADWIRAAGYDTRAVISLGTLWNCNLERGFEDFDEDVLFQADAEDIARRVHATLAERDPDKPLFLFAHFSDPHGPYNDHGGSPETATVTLDGEPLTEASISLLDVRDIGVSLHPGENVFVLESTQRFTPMEFLVERGGEPVPLTWEVGALHGARRHFRVVAEVPTETALEARLKFLLTDGVPSAGSADRYALEVEYVDRYVGEVLDDLKRDGLYDDALIVFTSDHGESLGEHDYYGHVRYLTDEEIHVPLIVKPPADRGRARKRLASRRGEIVRHIDVVPTLLDILDLPPLPGQQGRSLLLSEPSPPVLAETHRPQAPEDKLCLRDERYKLIYLVEEERFLMFDLTEDPGEQVDVFALRGNERSDWCQELLALAQRATALDPPEIDEESRSVLHALGY